MPKIEVDFTIVAFILFIIFFWPFDNEGYNLRQTLVCNLMNNCPALVGSKPY